ERGDYSYAPGKWTVKEVVGHLADTELVFSYRALRFGRGDATPLPGFEQDDWVPRAGCGERTLAEMVELLRRVRAASLALFAGFPDDAWRRRGVAAEAEIVVSAFPWINAGHELHHRRILRQRYGL
ncbi:MAG: DinB family protein, partial [Thermoanaerobaculia bacterium]